MKELKCNVKKCGARCCYNAPLPGNTILKHITEMVTQPYYFMNTATGEILDAARCSDAVVIPVTDLSGSQMQRCPFLSKDLKCVIYEDRPILCKCFGHPEILPNLGCSHLRQKECTDPLDIKIMDILKHFGVWQQIEPEYAHIDIDTLRKFVVRFPNGTVRDLIGSR